ncbi:hypothetical protein HQ587_04595 [bacterium]|nr:hypothetical protein [bacterium]
MIPSLTSILLIILIALLPVTGLVAQESELPPGDKPPQTVFDRIASAGDAETHDDADHVIVYDLTVNRVK